MKGAGGSSSSAYTCPFCAGKHCAVKDSRSLIAIERGRRRRRQCLDCGRRFTTYEIVCPSPEALAKIEELAHCMARLGPKRQMLVADLIAAIQPPLPEPEPS